MKNSDVREMNLTPEQRKEFFFLFPYVPFTALLKVDDNGRRNRTEEEEKDPEENLPGNAGILEFPSKKPLRPVEKHPDSNHGLTEEGGDEEHDNHLAFEVPS